MSVERSALNVERSAPHGAVFLSYAREEAAAAGGPLADPLWADLRPHPRIQALLRKMNLAK